MQNWKILKKIIEPKFKDLGKSHCMMPTIKKIKKDTIRVYYSSRDTENISRIFYSDYNLEKEKLLKSSSEPVLDIGELGAFDDNGVTPSCLISKGNYDYLFYVGWNKKSRVRMNLFGGLAYKKKGEKKFKRYFKSPILERNSHDYLFNTAPFVIKHKNKYLMYYSSTLKWINENLPVYNIKICESKNLINWKREGKVCINLKKKETALGRSNLIFHKKKFMMWYSYKGKNYKIGYAESKDGKKWVRKDNEILFVNRNKFNFEMMEFSFVFKHNKELYMLFNGNNYGEKGIYLSKLIRG
tara:strand:- start:142 stop:1035 length:894 start_codon:yes stop_codon:yes gene_type:complete